MRPNDYQVRTEYDDGEEEVQVYQRKDTARRAYEQACQDRPTVPRSIELVEVLSQWRIK